MADTKHEIVNIVELKGGVKLHRFFVGPEDYQIPYSAIYDDDFELWSCPGNKEEKMINDWNTSGWKTWDAIKKEYK